MVEVVEGENRPRDVEWGVQNISDISCEGLIRPERVRHHGPLTLRVG